MAEAAPAEVISIGVTTAAKSRGNPKPDSVAQSEYQSQVWDSLCADYSFLPSDTYVLADLCLQFDMIRIATESLTKKGDPAIIWNDDGVPKARPEIAVIERCNAQVAALKKQLGIYDRENASKDKPKPSSLEDMKKRFKVV